MLRQRSHCDGVRASFAVKKFESLNQLSIFTNVLLSSFKRGDGSTMNGTHNLPSIRVHTFDV